MTNENSRITQMPLNGPCITLGFQFMIGNKPTCNVANKSDLRHPTSRKMSQACLLLTLQPAHLRDLCLINQGWWSMHFNYAKNHNFHLRATCKPCDGFWLVFFGKKTYNTNKVSSVSLVSEGFIALCMGFLKRIMGKRSARFVRKMFEEENFCSCVGSIK